MEPQGWFSADGGVGMCLLCGLCETNMGIKAKPEVGRQAVQERMRGWMCWLNRGTRMQRDPPGRDQADSRDEDVKEE